ncbi:MAG TPA: cupin domain-containing protein [Bacillota bacterium]|nr:cupin domain-containing protein [Bacillota bacterium]
MIKNVFKSEKYQEIAHDGKGFLSKNRPFDRADFNSKIDFIDYVIVPPGTIIGKHRHDQNEEIYFLLKGNCRMEIEGEMVSVSAGDVIVNKPGGSHALINDFDTEAEIFIFQVSI